MVGNAHPTRLCYHKLWRKTMPQAVDKNPTIEELLAAIEASKNSTNSTTSGSSTSTAVTGGTVFTDSDFKDLTNDDDNKRLSPNELANFTGGLRSLGGNDTIVGSSSGEAINGNLGFDSLLGGGGDDTLRGGQNSDRIFGEDGNDIVNGNRGNDLVLGGNSNDIVRGGQDNDLLLGGEGRDTLIGDFGTDYLMGNDGDDLFILRTETAEAIASFADWIIDFDPNNDKIGLTGGLSRSDLSFETISLNLGSRLDFLTSFNGENFSSETEIPTQVLDPNGDGTVQGVLIRNNERNSPFLNTVLGIVLNVTEAQINNNSIFQSVPDSFLSLG